MRFDWSTLALQTVNFLILVWLLRRFLFRPVLAMIDRRREAIDRDHADARQAAEQSGRERDALIGQRAAIAAERTAALAEAASQAEALAETRRQQAERETEALLLAGQEALVRERRQAELETRRAALDLGVGIARRLLVDWPEAMGAEAWLRRISAHLAGLPVADRDVLMRQVAAEPAVAIVTAAPLAPDAARHWQETLATALGSPVKADFTVDSGLTAGAELHFPHSVLRLSWKSQVEALRQEIDADDHAQ